MSPLGMEAGGHYLCALPLPHDSLLDSPGKELVPSSGTQFLQCPLTGHP